MTRYKCHALRDPDESFALIDSNAPAAAAALFAQINEMHLETGEVTFSPLGEGESLDVRVVEIGGDHLTYREIGCAETYRVSNFQGELLATLIGRCVRPVEARNRCADWN